MTTISIESCSIDSCLQYSGQQSLKLGGLIFSEVWLQVEGSFSQPNGRVCCKMLEWAQKVTSGSTSGDLLELYCGNGNFTIALAENFR